MDLKEKLKERLQNFKKEDADPITSPERRIEVGKEIFNIQNQLHAIEQERSAGKFYEER